MDIVTALKPGDIVILDNLGSHKGQAVRDIARAASARLFFPPPTANRQTVRQAQALHAACRQTMRPGRPQAIAKTPCHNYIENTNQPKCDRLGGVKPDDDDEPAGNQRSHDVHHLLVSRPEYMLSRPWPGFRAGPKRQMRVQNRTAAENMSASIQTAILAFGGFSKPLICLLAGTAFAKCDAATLSEGWLHADVRDERCSALFERVPLP